MSSFVFLILGIFLLIPSTSFSAPAKTTYQARIIKPDGQPLQAANVSFRFTITNPTGQCVLYSEDYSLVNMSGSGGQVNFSLGNGVVNFASTSGTQRFAEIFDNTRSGGFTCKDTTAYVPTSNDIRKIVMQFNDGNGWQTLPAMAINSVPFSMFASKAEDSKKFDGKTVDQFAQVQSLPSCTVGQQLQFNGINFSCVTPAASGLQSFTSNKPSILQVGGSLTHPTIDIQVASLSSSGYLLSSDFVSFSSKMNNTASAVISALGFTPISSNTAQNIAQTEATAIASAAVASAMSSQVLAGDVSGNFNATSVDQVGGKSASQISTSVNDTQAATSNNTANVIAKRTSDKGILADYFELYRPSSSFAVRLSAPTSLAASYTLTLPTTQGSNGQVLAVDNSGQLNWINPSTGSVTSVTGASGQLVTTGSSSTVTLGLATTGVTSATYGSANKIPVLAVDSYGRVQNAGVVDFQDATSLQKGLVQVGSNISITGGVISISNANVVSALGFTPADTNDSRITNALNKNNNLSDLTSSATARTNLGLQALATKSNIDLSTSDATGILPLSKLPNGILTSATALAGDVTGNYNTTSINTIQGRAVSLAALSNGQILQVSGSAVRNITLPSCAANQYLTFNGTSWSCANDAGSAGSVSSLTQSGPITLSASTGAVTIGFTNSGVNAATYGAANTVPVFTVDQYGRITGVTSATTSVDWANITSKPTTLSGYGITDALSKTLTQNKILIGNNSNQAIEVVVSGDATLNNSGTLTLSNIVSATTLGGANAVPTLQIDSKGRVIGLTANAYQYADQINYGIIRVPANSNISINGTGEISLTSSNVVSALGYVPASNTALGNYLTKANNLSDLVSSATARSNLGLGNLATKNTVDINSEVSGVATSALTTNRILQTSGTQFVNKTIPTCAANQYLSYNGTSWVCSTDAGSAGNVSSLSATAPLSVTASTGAITISSAQASTSTSGFLAASDFTIFLNKVTNVTGTVNEITITGTTSAPVVSLAIVPTITSGAQYYKVTVDSKGRVVSGVSSLASTDIPNLDMSKITTGTLPITQGGTGATTSAAARTNLGLGSVATYNQGNSVGTIPVLGAAGITSGSVCTSSDGTTISCNTTVASFSQWSTSGTSIYNNNSGNVGIGLTNPNSALQVSGTIAATNGNNNFAQLSAINTTGGQLTLFDNSWTTGPTKRLNINFNQFSVSSSLNTKANIFYESTNLTSGSEKTNIGFSTMVNGTLTENMRITGDGFVGIGTSQPNRKFQIHEVNGGPAYLQLSASSTGTSNLDGFQIAVDGTNSDVGLIQRENSLLYLSTNNTPRFYVLGNGQIGVGLSTPTAKLHLTSGTATANTAPLKLSSGTLMTTAEAGAIEYDGNNLYFTDGLSNRRQLAAINTNGVQTNTSQIDSTGNLTLYPNNGNGSVIVSATTASTNPNTGALIVKGGLGVAGDIRTNGSVQVNTLTTNGVTDGFFASSNSGSAPMGYGFYQNSGLLDGLQMTSWGSAHVILDSDANDSARFFSIMKDGKNPASATELMRVNESGQLGLGTSSPSYQFDMTGSARISSSVSGGVRIGNGQIRIDSNSDAGNSLAFLGTQFVAGGLNSSSLGYSGGGLFAARTNGDGALLLDIGRISGSGTLQVQNTSAGELSLNLKNSAGNSALYINSSNSRLGVGTNNPTDKLHISGGTGDNYGTGLKISGPSADNNWLGGLTLSNSAETLTAQMYASTGGMMFNYGGVERMRIGSTGNVGIGTPSPTERLTIENNTGSANLLIKGTTTAGSTRAEVKLDRSDNPRGAGLRILDSISSGAQWWAGVPYNGGSASDFFTIGRHSTQPEYLTNSFLTLTASGNIGVGTTSPATKLHVSSGEILLDNNFALKNKAENGVAYDMVSTVTDGSVRYKGFHGTELIQGVNGATYIYTSGSNALAMTTLSNGNVGIGVTSPSSKLVINPNDGADANTRQISTVFNTSTTYNAAATNATNRIISGLSFDWYSDSWKLGATRGGATDIDGFVFSRNGSEKMVLSNAGNLGLGTTTPSSKIEAVVSAQPGLAITGNSSSYVGSDIIIRRNSTATGVGQGAALQFDDISNTTNNNLIQMAAGALQFFNYGSGFWSEKMRIAKDGNVGIGTTTPTQKLDVSGKINAQGFSYPTGTWVDIGPNRKTYITDMTTGIPACSGGFTTYNVATTLGGTRDQFWTGTIRVVARYSGTAVWNSDVFVHADFDGNTFTGNGWQLTFKRGSGVTMTRGDNTNAEMFINVPCSANFARLMISLDLFVVGPN